MSYKCAYCDKEFNGQFALNQHVKAKHGNLPQPNSDNPLEVTVQLPNLGPGRHKINCPLCQQPAEVAISTAGMEKPSSSSKPRVPDADELPPAQPYEIKARMEQRLGKKTLAIIGTHPQSLAVAPWDEYGIDEFWGMNDGHGLAAIERNLDKFTTWFQLHHRWRFTRHQARRDTNHWLWLQKSHDLTIYMQRQFADIPNSEKFPLREVCEELLDDKLARGAGFVQQYFTSTFAYAIAFAIYQKVKGIKDWERMEIYGCELLQTETEYFRQRPGIEWWLGYAAAVGIQVYVPEITRILYSQKVLANGQLFQYPGYMAYGYKSPSMKEAEKQKLPIGEDPTEENLIGSWEDYHPDFDTAKRKWVYHALEMHKMDDLEKEYEELSQFAPN